METIFVLLPLALLIAAIAVGFFIWAARTGQFDDLDTPAVRILFDDEEPRRPAPAIATPGATPGDVLTTPQPSMPSISSSRRVPE
ncbi:MAG: cbb3-type cytochrome oxidase assembly protein CcoS [Acidobacteria bacterium]|jgi:cbb3-type cytochrome oxidase maturation protein|nr:cbb3-type cytochrome oxidase assembly protein CcoS [Acidobacteriota bacterium]